MLWLSVLKWCFESNLVLNMLWLGLIGIWVLMRMFVVCSLCWSVRIIVVMIIVVMIIVGMIIVVMIMVIISMVVGIVMVMIMIILFLVIGIEVV